MSQIFITFRPNHSPTSVRCITHKETKRKRGMLYKANLNTGTSHTGYDKTKTKQKAKSIILP